MKYPCFTKHKHINNKPDNMGVASYHLRKFYFGDAFNTMLIESFFIKQIILLFTVLIITTAYPANSFTQHLFQSSINKNYSFNNTSISMIKLDDPDFQTEEPWLPSPAKAAMLSAALPGLGQMYNRKYWKVPIVYGGFVTLGYFYNLNNKHYQHFRKAYYHKIDGNPHTEDFYPNHTADRIRRARDYYWRNLEIVYLLTGALYILNILDASVDAHLMDFDLSEDLSMRMEPLIENYDVFYRRQSFGIKFTLNF